MIMMRRCGDGGGYNGVNTAVNAHVKTDDNIRVNET